MLRVMRDETVDHARRDAMAKAVAPYCHPQLASVATTNETGRHADNMAEEELIKAIEEQANRLGWKIDFSHSTTSRAVKRSGRDRHARTDPCPNRCMTKEKHASGSLGNLPSSSPPAEKATTRQDQAGQARTSDGAGHGTTCSPSSGAPVAARCSPPFTPM